MNPEKETKLVNLAADHHNLHYISCNLCGADNQRTLYVIQNMKIQRCQECGLVFVNPRIEDPNPHNIYDRAYFEYYILTAAANRKTYTKRLELLEQHCPQKGRILDVGCSTGDFLEIAFNRGWNPQGIDVSDAYADEIRNKLKIPMDVGDFVTFDLTPSSFDVVNMGDSIEHMLDPKTAVQKVYDLLKPGGIGYIRAPDINGISPRLAKHRWIQLKPFEHFYYFTRQTMRRLLEEQGFQILSLGNSGTYCSLNILLNRLTHYYNLPLMPKILHFLAHDLKLGEVRFYLDVLEELQVIFRKPW